MKGVSVSSIRYYSLLFVAFIFVYGCQPFGVRKAVEPHPVTEEGLIASALYAAGRVTSDEVKSNMLRRIALMKLSKNETDTALDLAGQIPVQTERDRTTAEIAIFLSENGGREHARSLAGQIQSDFHRSRILAEVAVAYERAGEYRRGRELAEKISDPNFQARAVAGIAVIYYAGGYGDLASRLFNQALQAARREQSITHHIETLLYISQKYNEAGQRQRSREVFSNVLELTDQIGNEQHLVNVWGAILNTYSGAGQNDVIIERAISVARAMGDNAAYYRDELVSRVAIAYANVSSYDRMFDAIEEIGDIPLRATTKSQAAVIAERNGDREKANGLLVDATALSEQISGEVFKQRVLLDIGIDAANIIRFDIVDTVIDMLDAPRSVAEVALHAAHKAMEQDNTDAFARFAKQSVEALDAIGDPVEQAAMLVSLAELYDRSGFTPDEDTTLIVSKILHTVD